MSEDKTKTLPGNEKTEADLLREELENLRGTFQQKLDETTKEMESMPVIQELEYGEDMTEEYDAENEEQPVEKHTKKSVKKKHKVGKIIAITIPAVLLALIIAFLAAYVAVSISNPNFNSFVSAYAMGNKAESYDEKISYYEKAVEFCTDENSKFQNELKAMALECIIEEMYKEKGYSETYTYMKAHMSDAMIEKSRKKEIREIISVNESVNLFSLSAFEAVIKNVGDKTEVPELSVLSRGLVIPEEIKSIGESVLKTIAEGYIYNRSKENLGDSITSVTGFYSPAYNALVAQGADKNELAQEIACSLYYGGFVFESAVFSYINIDPELAQLSDDYSLIREELNVFSQLDLDIIGIAEKAISENKTSGEDVKLLVKNSLGKSEKVTDVLSLMVMSAIEALKAEENNDLNGAGSAYSSIISAQSVVGMDVSVSSLRICRIVLTMGNFDYFSQVYSTYLTEEAVSGLNAEDKALYDEITEIYTSYTEMLKLCSAEYQKFSETAKYEEQKDALLALVTDDKSDMKKGFIYYFIADIANYYGSDDALLYYEKCKELLPEMPFLYAENLLDAYLKNERYNEAEKFALYLISCDTSLEYPYCYAAMGARARGDIDSALEMAEQGMAVSESFINCCYDAAVAYMLKGEIETAFNYISKCYKNSQPSIELYDLVLIYDAVYDGENEDINNSLKEMVENVNKAYESSNVKSYEDTNAVINGEKTLADVFLKGNCTLR